jgi:hypothetical protein
MPANSADSANPRNHPTAGFRMIALRAEVITADRLGNAAQLQGVVVGRQSDGTG